MRAFICTDHPGEYYDAKSVVVADDEATARSLLCAAITERGLDPDTPFTLRPLDLDAPAVVTLHGGDCC